MVQTLRITSFIVGLLAVGVITLSVVHGIEVNDTKSLYINSLPTLLQLTVEPPLHRAGCDLSRRIPYA